MPLWKKDGKQEEDSCFFLTAFQSTIPLDASLQPLQSQCHSLPKQIPSIFKRLICSSFMKLTFFSSSSSESESESSSDESSSSLESSESSFAFAVSFVSLVEVFDGAGVYSERREESGWGRSVSRARPKFLDGRFGKSCIGKIGKEKLFRSLSGLMIIAITSSSKRKSKKEGKGRGGREGKENRPLYSLLHLHCCLMNRHCHHHLKNQNQIRLVVELVPSWTSWISFLSSLPFSRLLVRQLFLPSLRTSSPSLRFCRWWLERKLLLQ